MIIDILHRPGSSAARVRLAPGETCTAEGGAMIAMTPDLEVTTTSQQKSGGGGMLRAMKRVLSGESFFLNHFRAGHGGGELYLATSLPGDMVVRELSGEGLVAQGGSYVASEPGISVDLGWQGFKSLLSGERIFWLRLAGRGKVVLSSFGAIYPVVVDGESIVDTGHIVAFEDTLDFSVSKAGKSWLSSILGGEGLVCKFRGRGTVWCQSHHPTRFGQLLGPLLKPR